MHVQGMHGGSCWISVGCRGLHLCRATRYAEQISTTAAGTILNASSKTEIAEYSRPRALEDLSNAI